MTTGLVLIAAILILGGVIATVGDRLGMRVGKARLTLFNLRPRQTATLITVLTGIVISATTFGILFAISDQLRTGVFELNDIQRDLATAREELQQTQTDKSRIEAELETALRQRGVAQRRLTEINQSLQRAIAQQERTEIQAETLRRDIEQLQEDRQRQIAERDQEIAKLQEIQSERQEQLSQRDREIAQRNQQIAESNRRIQQGTRELAVLEEQRRSLDQEVQQLTQEFQGLREGSVALSRGQALAAGVLRIIDTSAAPQAVVQLLREANRVALQRIQRGQDTPDSGRESLVLQFEPGQVERLLDQIQDGRNYFVRILSAGNYVLGEPCVVAGEACVQVQVTAALNQVVYQPGQVVSTISADPRVMDDRRLLEQFYRLIILVQLNSRQDGVLGDVLQIADGNNEPVVNFFRQLRQYNQAVEIRAIAADTVYTSGPIRLDLEAVRGSTVLFGTNPTAPTLPPPLPLPSISSPSVGPSP